MPNKDRALGMQPHGEVCQATEYDAGGTIYPGAPVKLNSSGLVVAAAAGDTLLGAALSYASSGQKVLVADDPSQRFSIQAAGSNVDAQTDIGNNADVAIAVDATYKISRAELDDSTLTAAGSAQLQILAVEPQVGEGFGANAKCIVRINEHQLVDGKSGV